MLGYVFFVFRLIKKQFYIPYNRLKLKLNNATIGDNCNVFNKTYVLFHKGTKVVIGDNFTLKSDDFLNPLGRNFVSGIYAANNAEIIIGNNVGASSVCIWSTSKIVIGNYVKIGADVTILDNDAHSMDFFIRRDISKDIANACPITIEDDVLIGTRSIILKGVTIGARSIIGAGSVVTKSIPADCIAAGNPCRVIRQLVKD